jgi:hypothetical protein
LIILARRTWNGRIWAMFTIKSSSETNTTDFVKGTEAFKEELWRKFPDEKKRQLTEYRLRSYQNGS